METSIYKELSYKLKGFRALSILVAAVTVILCLLVGIGCWVLIDGVRENENLLKEAETVHETLEVDIVEGHIQEPLQLTKKESLNKVGRVVQHIAEIDFDEGSPAASKEFSHQAPSVPEQQEVQQQIYHDPRDLHIIQEKIGQPISIDGVVGVRLQPPAVGDNNANFMSRVGGAAPNNGRYLKNELSVVEVPAAVYSASYQESNPTNSPPIHQAILESLVNFTSDLTDDIAKQGLFHTIADRTSEKAMRDTFQWIGDYTSQLMHTDQPASRSKRFAGIPLAMAEKVLSYFNYASFGRFMMNEVNAIAEYNIEARKFSGDPEAEFLDSDKWASPTTTGRPHTNNSTHNNNKKRKPAPQRWEPQVNKVSMAFIGEILTTLLNMMREYLMKDHVMECLWFMFCEDLNHQAQYADAYGLIARVNSVGLKVLTEPKERQMDTIGEVWRALTAWQTLHCESMFPRCDGPKALEIVNEVALGNGKKK